MKHKTTVTDQSFHFAITLDGILDHTLDLCHIALFQQGKIEQKTAEVIQQQHQVNFLFVNVKFTNIDLS